MDHIRVLLYKVLQYQFYLRSFEEVKPLFRSSIPVFYLCNLPSKCCLSGQIQRKSLSETHWTFIYVSFSVEEEWENPIEPDASTSSDPMYGLYVPLVVSLRRFCSQCFKHPWALVSCSLTCSFSSSFSEYFSTCFGNHILALSNSWDGVIFLEGIIRGFTPFSSKAWNFFWLEESIVLVYLAEPTQGLKLRQTE